MPFPTQAVANTRAQAPGYKTESRQVKGHYQRSVELDMEIKRAYQSTALYSGHIPPHPLRRGSGLELVIRNQDDPRSEEQEPDSVWSRAGGHDTRKDDLVREEDLITYCGGYGGTCARWCGYTKFRDTAALLGEWVDAQGYQYWMPHETQEFDYREFRKGLEFFSKSDSWLVCHRCCKGGDGNPDCELRRCCRERGLEMCFDCDEFPCARTKGSAMSERAREYRAQGKPEWLRQQVQRANQGFEAHTKKYYEVGAGEDLPKA